MGHEVSGVVAAVGEGVDAAWVGASVVSETYFSTCGRCPWCRDGRINLCPERRSIGSFVDGAFARHLVVPVTNLHRIPAWLDEHAAVLIEPLACVCQCLCDPAQRSRLATACSSPVQGRWGCSPRRWRVRWAER